MKPKENGGKNGGGSTLRAAAAAMTGLPVLKIRGMYATAFTCFFLDEGFLVACPSPTVARRFGGEQRLLVQEDYEVEIGDWENGRGVFISGPSIEVAPVLTALRETFWDAVFHRQEANVTVDLPALSKAMLDELRHRVVPTVPGHHWLKGFASSLVDLLEKKELAGHPDKRGAVGRNLAAKLIWERYKPGREIGIEHIKPDGRVISLLPGRIMEADRHQGRLLLRREGFRPGGRYDGLGAEKNADDYDLCTFVGGRWHYRHRHFRRDGEPIGGYFNVNTPVEFLPDRVRYIDLEIDTVAWPDGRTAVIDKQKLAESVEAGRISDRLRHQAESTARQLAAGLEPE